MIPPPKEKKCCHIHIIIQTLVLYYITCSWKLGNRLVVTYFSLYIYIYHECLLEWTFFSFTNTNMISRLHCTHVVTTQNRTSCHLGYTASTSQFSCMYWSCTNMKRFDYIWYVFHWFHSAAKLLWKMEAPISCILQHLATRLKTLRKYSQVFNLLYNC
jgi:hypothetical protein